MPDYRVFLEHGLPKRGYVVIRAGDEEEAKEITETLIHECQLTSVDDRITFDTLYDPKVVDAELIAASKDYGNPINLVDAFVRRVRQAFPDTGTVAATNQPSQSPGVEAFADRRSRRGSGDDEGSEDGAETFSGETTNATTYPVPQHGRVQSD